ncbi:MAG: ribosome biogenesis GTP-binding protein YsxC [Sandaracinaceae bacterium]|nr:ribosome biogenesis GTP-binding protein YsxC [Sandaracinaceae bacterium]
MQVLDAQFVATATVHSGLPAPAFAEVAFAGRSNVGKSSLINKILSRRKLVRTSQTPGCTRGLSIFRARLRFGDDQEGVLDLVDLPGFGYAKRSKVERRSWGPMVEGFLTERAGLRAVVSIFDVRRGPEEDDLELLAFLQEHGVVSIPVATKIDKLPASKRKPALLALAGPLRKRPIGFSSVTGDGVEELWRVIQRVAGLG